MKLVIVESKFTDYAWRDGANCLAEACDTSGGEITGDQLKMILARGERTLVRMDDEGKAVGWGVFRVDPLPNIRALHITDLVCHNAQFQRFFDELKMIAGALGCSEIRISCRPAQARLFKRTNQFEHVYETLRVRL